MKPSELLIIPSPGTWWIRRCNGKRYYLRDAPKPAFTGGSKLYVWIYEEGVNHRCLHLPLSTLLKRYDRYTEPHVTSGPGLDPERN